MASSVESQFGRGVDTSEFSVENIVKQGRCCASNFESSSKWYGLIHNDGIVLCDYCVKNINPSAQGHRLSEIASPTSFISDCSFKIHSERMRDLGMDNRFTVFNDMRVNVNITDKDGEEFTPALKPSGDKSKMASKNGVHAVLLPDKCFPEIVIRGNPTSSYNFPGNKNYFKIVDAYFDNGTKITLKKGINNNNLIIPFDSSMRIDSLIGGDNSTRLFYAVPTEAEMRHGLAASHTGKSNKIILKIQILTEQKVLYRGGGSSGQTRGGGLTRGGGGGSYNQGGTFTTEGVSHSFSTTQFNGNLKVIKELEMIVQFINNESQATLQRQSEIVEAQVQKSKEDEIAALRRQLAELEGRSNCGSDEHSVTRSDLFGGNQRDFLL